MKIRKSALKMLLAAMLAALFALSPVGASATVGKYYVANGSGVRIRETPVSGSAVVGKLKKGEKVVHLGTKGGWWRIRTSDNTTGYVYRSYLSSYNAIKVGKLYRPKSSKGMKVYARPNAKAAVKGKVSKNTTCVLLARKGSWGQIRVVSSGKVGYVPVKYLQLKQ